MANRLFLTLLALMTGLAAQIGPAQARTCAASAAEIGAVASVAVATEQRARSRHEVGGEVSGACADEREPRLDKAAHSFRVATVLTGIDRARE